MYQELTRLFEGVVDEARRAAASLELAAYLGGQRLIIFIRDFELGIPLPATGFPQTLPEGERWRAFLDHCDANGQAVAELPSPYDREPVRVAGRCAAGGSMLVLLGGRPDAERLAAATDLLPLAAAALAGEQRALAASARAEVERDSAQRAVASTAALEGARRQLQQALAAAHEARHDLEQALRARDDFLSSASHELRNPIHALHLQIQGLLLVAGRSDPPLDRDWLLDRLARADGQVARLADLVSHLLDVACLQEGGLPLEPERLDLVEVVEEVLERFSGMAGPGQLELRAPASLPGRWDRLRLDQVISNLVSNGIKYGEGKPVDLSLAQQDGHALLRVRDHGRGISPDHRRRIFERFTRARLDERREGFGLGLWIAKRALEALGGDIEVESPDGGGTAFVVSLPVSPDR